MNNEKVTRAEAQVMIDDAIAVAMAKHNRNATIISMILGIICLALFLDGLLRILGIVPPFMDLDVNVIDDVIDTVKDDVIPYINNLSLPRL